MPLRKVLDFARTLDAVEQAVIVTDASGTVLFWNRAAETLYGWPASDVLGRPIMEVTPAEHTAADAEAVMAQLAAGEPWSGDMLLRRKDGDTLLARVTDAPILDDAGEIVGIIGISEDVTEQRQAEQALRASEQRLRLALDAGSLGVWQWDRRTDTIEWDGTLEALFGLAPGYRPASFDDFVDLIHPDDRAEVVGRVQAAFADAQEFTVTHRVTWPDGSEHWIEGHAQALWDDGEVIGLVGVARDVTALREHDAERTRLLEEERRARADAEASRARLAFLAGASEVLHDAADLDERLRRLARLSAPRVGDACTIHLLGEDGVPQLAAVHHVDPIQETALRDIATRNPIRLDAPFGAGAAIREERTSWVPEVTDQMLEAMARDERHLAALRRLDITAGVSIPLVGRGGPVGALTVFTTGGRQIDDDDLRLAEELCIRAGTIIENAQLVQLREAMEAAGRFHAALLATLYGSSIDGMLVVDPAGNVLSHNERFLELWGFEPSLVEAGDQALLDTATTKVADPAGFLAGVADAYDRRPATVHDEVAMADGRTLDRYGAALRADDGEYLGFAWSFRDVTVERRQRAEIAAAGRRFAALARTLQQSLLPPRLPRLPGVELAARYHPALDGLEVGGDFYDVFAVGDDWLLVIGDVCGKGAEAAALTALIRYTIRAVAIQNPDPAAVLAELNTVMLHDADTALMAGGDRDARFASVCCVRLRPGPDGTTAAVACGGHPLPLVVRVDGHVEATGAPGTVIGVIDDVDITTVTVQLRPGDLLVAYTDGVTESRDRAGTQLEGEPLAQALRPLAGQSAAAVSAAVEERAMAWQGGVAHDDIAVLVARATPG